MQDRLAQYFLPAEATVLGVRLQPFTLWHWRTLSALESPLLDGKLDELEPADPTYEDLALAVRVCALKANTRHEKLMEALRPGYWMRRKFRRARKLDFDTELGGMALYLNAHCKGPKPMVADGESPAPVSSHQVMYLATGLMNQLGFSEAEAWATSPGMARWYLVAAAEAAGHKVAIVSDSHVRQALEAGYSLEDCEL
jgi:hypothetical protein